MSTVDVRPDSVLRRTFGVSTRTAVARVLETYGAASVAQREAGAGWYGQARTVAEDVGAGDVRYGAALVAALSPRTRWDDNVALALEYGDTGTCTGTLTANVRRADRVRAAFLAGGDPSEALVVGASSRKVRAFCETIATAGDTRRVTIDVWALSVLTAGHPGTAQTRLGNVGAYDACEHVYRIAASRLGVDVSTVQAVTWLVARTRYARAGRVRASEVGLGLVYA